MANEMISWTIRVEKGHHSTTVAAHIVVWDNVLCRKKRWNFDERNPVMNQLIEITNRSRHRLPLPSATSFRVCFFWTPVQQSMCVLCGYLVTRESHKRVTGLNEMGG